MAQENDSYSSTVTHGILVDIESSDFYEDYELPSEGELQTPGWVGEFVDIGNGNDVPQPTPVHEKPAVLSSWEAKVTPPPIKLSSAIDMRLELGLEMEAEQDLKMLELLQAEAIAKALSTTVPPSRGTPSLTRERPTQNGKTGLAELALQSSFSKIFSKPQVDMSSLLSVWLKIKLCCSSLKLDTASIRLLLSHLVKQPESSLQTRHLCLQVLTVVSDQQWKACADQELLTFLKNEDLLDFLVNLLSQIPSFGAHSILPSPKPVKAFLSSLQSAVESHSDVKVVLIFQDFLLKVILELCKRR